MIGLVSGSPTGSRLEGKGAKETNSTAVVVSARVREAQALNLPFSTRMSKKGTSEK
jgi:hypothetical protein